MTSPAEPSSRTTGSPAADQAFMPPVMFCTSRPASASACAALPERAPLRHTVTSGRSVGTAAGSSAPERGVRGQRRVPGRPLVVLADVDQVHLSGFCGAQGVGGGDVADGLGHRVLLMVGIGGWDSW